MPLSLVGASAVPGTGDAWVVAGRYGDRFELGNFLLRFRCRNWTKVATFGRDIHLEGVAAVSASSAWVWGEDGRGGHRATFRPYVALVSAGVASRVSTGLLGLVDVKFMAGGSAGGVWLAGHAPERHGLGLRVVAARWDGTSWRQVPAPARARAVWSLSASGPADAWAVVSTGSFLRPWLVHWDGRAWSTAYAPPASLAAGGRAPVNMAAGSSAGRAWVAFTEAALIRGNRRPARIRAARAYTAYFDGGTWRTVPVPTLVQAGLSEITMSGGDAWAISGLQNIGKILYSHLGVAWRLQALPGGRHKVCVPESISAGSADYVIAVTTVSSGWCPRSYAYIYDGHRWLSANPHPPR